MAVALASARRIWHASVPEKDYGSLGSTLEQTAGLASIPAPGLGEHNGYVLGELLGLSAQEIAALEAQDIIGTRPSGTGES